MFEQTLLTPQSKPWTIAASLTLQCATVGAVLLYSLIHFEVLGPVTLSDPLPPAPRFPESVKVVAVERFAGSSAVLSTAPAIPKPFTAPSRIPAGIPTLVENPTAGIALAPGTAQGGLASGGGLPGILGAGAGSLPPPPPPVPQVKPEPKRVLIGGNVMEAKIVRRVLPSYPALAKSARISGKVELLGVIARDGTVQNLTVVSGHPMLVRAALEAVRQWTYKPTLLNGDPVEVMTPITVTFTLTN